MHAPVTCSQSTTRQPFTIKWQIPGQISLLYCLSWFAYTSHGILNNYDSYGLMHKSPNYFILLIGNIHNIFTKMYQPPLQLRKRKMIHIGWLSKANLKIRWKWVQTALLTTICNLLYTFCIRRLLKSCRW